MSGTSRRGSSTSVSRTSSTPRTTASARTPGAKPGGRQPAGNGMAHQVGDHGAGCQEPCQVDAGLIADVIEEVDELFGGEVAGGAVGERRTTQAADGRVETTDAELDGGVGVDEGGTPAVVKVQA